MSRVKKHVYSALLKLCKDGELRTEHGNRFHAAGPATTNARPPNVVLVRWTTRSPRADDRVQPSTQELAQSSDKYAGASPRIALYIIRHSLNWLRCATGSQCSWSRIKPVTCEYFPAKHPCRSIHHTLQTIKNILRQSSEKTITVVNPADYKAVD